MWGSWVLAMDLSAWGVQGTSNKVCHAFDRNNLPNSLDYSNGKDLMLHAMYMDERKWATADGLTGTIFTEWSIEARRTSARNSCECSPMQAVWTALMWSCREVKDIAVWWLNLRSWLNENDRQTCRTVIRTYCSGSEQHINDSRW